MYRAHVISRILAASSGLCSVLGAILIAPDSASGIDFSHQVVPILREHCADCHAGEKQKGGFSMNTRETLLEGSENGEVVAPRDLESYLLELISTDDSDIRMPPKGDGLDDEEVAILRKWVEDGLNWEAGFAFGEQAYEPPLEHREVAIPRQRIPGAINAIDQIVGVYLEAQESSFPEVVSDAAFARRVHLDLVGQLPDPETLERFLASGEPNKRETLIDQLLARDPEYAAHWVSFWNDLLRNAYQGTGFIDGGRRQVTDWLIESLANNKPYDDFVRELIVPPDEHSSGFINGIKWRGDVNASQTREIQFAQNVGQVFLGINMKCASCHDSFIDRWKLEDAYQLAAVFAKEPVEIHRCDKPTGEIAEAGWIFPELGEIDAKAAQPERLEQLAALLVHRDNGRTTRTIVNRIWHRLMGRGIVHPVDAMHTEPWSEDLLDYLANYLVEQDYDLKALMRHIAVSRSYQSASVSVQDEAELAARDYRFSGPVGRRMSAEQFIDAVEQIGGLKREDNRALLLRVSSEEMRSRQREVTWLGPEAGEGGPDPNAPFTVRAEFVVKPAYLSAEAARARFAVAGPHELLLNGHEIASGKDIDVGEYLQDGINVLSVKIPASDKPRAMPFVFGYVVAQLDGGAQSLLDRSSDWSWFAGDSEEGESGKALVDAQWKGHPQARQWQRQTTALQMMYLKAHYAGLTTARAGLRPSDLLQRSLGRPNREQVVSNRGNKLTMLQAMDLSNGDRFASLVKEEAAGYGGSLPAEADAAQIVNDLFVRALSRRPSDAERAAAIGLMEGAPRAQSLEDLLWVVFMMPEFQVVQ